MASQQPQQPQFDVVSGEQYRYALTNFRIAHEKVEQQRIQLEEQERQIALLRARITLLEGGDTIKSVGGNSVDDFSIKNAASQLERVINRWAADIIRTPPTPLNVLCDALLTDLAHGSEPAPRDISPMHVQNLLRHAISEVISECMINCLIITDSPEANLHLTRVHEHLFARDPTVACVWRRQTFSVALETCPPDMAKNMLLEQLPTIMDVLLPSSSGFATKVGSSILEPAFAFSRMLHGSQSTSGGTSDAFYRAFVPEIASMLDPRQIELVKRCLRCESGEICRVGATIFPGLNKLTRGPATSPGQATSYVSPVVRRAQVICECALCPPRVQPPNR